MGIFDFLKRKTPCPLCGNEGARSKDDRVLCPNPQCGYFDESIGPKADPIPTGGGFVPARSITIRYRNFQGFDREFTCAADSGYWRQHHLVIRAAPTGKRITLARERILNLAEVESALPRPVPNEQPWPSPRERQVLNYHKKYKTTSPLYEQIRAKYPEW